MNAHITRWSHGHPCLNVKPLFATCKDPYAAYKTYHITDKQFTHVIIPFSRQQWYQTLPIVCFKMYSKFLHTTRLTINFHKWNFRFQEAMASKMPTILFKIVSSNLGFTNWWDWYLSVPVLQTMPTIWRDLRILFYKPFYPIELFSILGAILNKTHVKDLSLEVPAQSGIILPRNFSLLLKFCASFT